jgi:hypothetical protein
MLDSLQSTAAGLGAGRQFDHARRLVEVNGAMAQRAVVASGGMMGLVGWLAERFGPARLRSPHGHG